MGPSARGAMEWHAGTAIEPSDGVTAAALPTLATSGWSPDAAAADGWGRDAAPPIAPDAIAQAMVPRPNLPPSLPTPAAKLVALRTAAEPKHGVA